MSPLFRPSLFAWSLAALGLAGWGAQAAEVSVYTTTLAGGRPDAVDGQVKTVVPLYQLVGVRAKHIELGGFDEVGVAVDAWGGLTLPNAPGGITAGDVNLAWVEGRILKKRLKLRLGRQLVMGGVARATFFDGLSAEYRSKLGIGLSAFAGIPVERRFANYYRGDWVVGTRLFVAPSINTEVGASFIHLVDRGAISRQDVGLDARWRPLPSLTLAGALVWNIWDGRLSEFDLGPRWALSSDLEVQLGYRRTAPELFLPRTSIFTVFADTSRDEVGGSITWQATRALSVFGDLHPLLINGELGLDASLRLLVRPFRSPSSALTVHYHRLSVPANGYHQGRIGARHTLPSGLGLSADLETYALDRPIRGQTLSFSASATATYHLSPSWFLGATVFAATTPTFESRYEAVAKLTWLFPAEGTSQ